MFVTTEFTLKPCIDTDAERSETSEILVKGEPTGTIIEGCCLNAAVAWQDKILFFIDFDCPFEEELAILLLDKQLKVLDKAFIYAIYTPGIFENLELSEPDTVRFSFFGNDLWEVQLLDKPRIRIPFISEPGVVHRPFGFSRRFIVRGKFGLPKTSETKEADASHDAALCLPRREVA